MSSYLSISGAQIVEEFVAGYVFDKVSSLRSGAFYRGILQKLRKDSSITLVLDSQTNTLRHVPRGPIVNLKLAFEVLSRDSSIRGADKMNREEPFGEWDVGVMKDRSGSNRILVAAIDALIQMAVFARLAFRVKGHNPPRATSFSDANEAIRPANLLKMSDTELFGIENLEHP